MIDYVKEMIAPYVENDITKFCTYEEFKTGADTLKAFCLLRAESVKGQLDGTIAATFDGQNEDSTSLVEASHISIYDMGAMESGKGIGPEKTNEQDKGTMPYMPRHGQQNNNLGENRPKQYNKE